MNYLLSKYRGLEQPQKVGLIAVVVSGVFLLFFLLIVTSRVKEPVVPPKKNDDEILREEFNRQLREEYLEYSQITTNRWGNDAIIPNNYEATFFFENGAKTYHVKRANDLFYVNGQDEEFYFGNKDLVLYKVMLFYMDTGNWEKTFFTSKFMTPEAFINQVFLEELLQNTPTISQNNNMIVKKAGFPIYYKVVNEYLGTNFSQGGNAEYTITIQKTGNKLSSINIDFPVENQDGARKAPVKITYKNINKVETFTIPEEIINRSD